MSTNHKGSQEETYPNHNIDELEDNENNPEVKILNPPEESTKSVHLECDEILKQLGGFGNWQWLNFSLLCLPVIMSGLVLLTYSFTGKMTGVYYLFG